MFLHGLGLGLLQYHQLVKSLVKELPNHPIIIPLQPHISQNIFHPRFLSPLKPAEAITCITKTIVEMGWTDTGVDILSHSKWVLLVGRTFVLITLQRDILSFLDPESLSRTCQTVMFC